MTDNPLSPQGDGVVSPSSTGNEATVSVSPTPGVAVSPDAQALTPQSSTPDSPHPVAVPFKAFDWNNNDVEIFSYTAWWKGTLLFEVGYLRTPQEVQTSIRRVLPNYKGYSSYLGDIERPLYRVRTLARLNKIIFVENELAADALNQRIAQMELGEKMIATTTSGGAGQSHKTQFAQNVKGQEILLTGKDIFVLVGSAPAGAAYADEICRACCGAAKSVKRVELSDLSPSQTQQDYFQFLDDIGEILELLEVAPEWTP